MKKDISEILKPGVTLKDIKTIDYNSPKFRKKLQKLKKEQERCENNKNVNWTKLANMYITK